MAHFAYSTKKLQVSDIDLQDTYVLYKEQDHIVKVLDYIVWTST